jgi:uncharacterized protein (TIGR03435 family)
MTLGALLLIAGLALEPRSAPQSAGTPRFEAASVKPAAPQPPGYGTFMRPEGGPETDDPGHLRWTNVTLSFVVKRAYALKDYQLDAPKWLDSDRVDIVAKVPAGATKEDLLPMLQNLLIERFGLAAHREQRDLPVFSLTVTKGGPKLAAAGSNTGHFPPPGFPALPGGAAEGISAWGTAEGSLRMTGKSQSTADLTDYLQNFVSRPVRDATGLKAKYDFTLEFTPENMRPAGALSPAPPQVPDDQPVTVFEALQNQLGLNLEPGKGSVSVLVIDRVEKTPTEN